MHAFIEFVCMYIIHLKNSLLSKNHSRRGTSKIQTIYIYHKCSINNLRTNINKKKYLCIGIAQLYNLTNLYLI